MPSITFLYLNFLACGGVFDVAFIVDTSGSVASHFNTLITFVTKFIDKFDIGVDRTHVALLTFNDDAYVRYRLNDSHNAETLKAFANAINTPAGETFIDKALKKANDEIFTTSKGWRRNVDSVSTPLFMHQ